MWLKPTAQSSLTQFFIGQDEGGGNTNKWAFGTRRGSIVFHVNNPAFSGAWIASREWVPELGKWYHLAVVRSEDTYSIYIDATCVSSAANGIPIASIEAPLTIGRAEGAFTEGTIDEVMIFSRALSADEIRDLGKRASGRPTAVWDGKTHADDGAPPSGLYMVIDLSGEAKATRYPVTYLDAVPEGGWTDEYKTGSWCCAALSRGLSPWGVPKVNWHEARMKPSTKSPSRSSTSLRCSKRPQRQWELVMGHNPSRFAGSSYSAARPVENVSYSDIRAGSAGHD